MKKLIAMLLALVMVFGLMACATTEKPDETDEQPGTSDTNVDTETPETEEPETPDAETEQPETEEPETETPDTETPETPETPDTEAPETVGDEKLASILTTLLTDLDADFLPYFTSYEIGAEDAPYVVGYEGLDTGFEAALAYGPMMGSTAFIMTLFRLPDGMDAAAYAKELQENADPIKWICVSADYVDATTNGQYVLFLMSSLEACDETVRQELADRFAAIDVDTLA